MKVQANMQTDLDIILLFYFIILFYFINVILLLYFQFSSVKIISVSVSANKIISSQT